MASNKLNFRILFNCIVKLLSAFCYVDEIGGAMVSPPEL